jgi:hypothetical protein
MLSVGIAQHPSTRLPTDRARRRAGSGFNIAGLASSVLFQGLDSARQPDAWSYGVKFVTGLCCEFVPIGAVAESFSVTDSLAPTRAYRAPIARSE